VHQQAVAEEFHGKSGTGSVRQQNQIKNRAKALQNLKNGIDKRKKMM